jgi:hypothetical protein
LPTEPHPRRSDDQLLALVHRKAGAIRKRRLAAYTAAGAGLCLLVAGVGAGVAERGGGRKRLVRAANGPSTSGAPETTTSEETSTTTAGGVVTPITQAPPTTTTTAVPPVHWAARSGGLSMEVTADPGASPAGTVVVFTVKLHSDHADPLPMGYDFGDGTKDEYGNLACDVIANGKPQGAPPDSPAADKTVIYTHAYRIAGTYTTAFYAVGTVCDPKQDDVTAGGPFTVRSGPKLDNGPVPPEVMDIRPCYQTSSSCASSSQHPLTPPPTPDENWVDAQMRDTDGFVSQVSFDWGDGTPKTTGRFTDCHDDGHAWPHNDAYPTAAAGHRYAHPGHYTVTVTVRSSGCRGQQPQTASKAASVDSPPPA